MPVVHPAESVRPFTETLLQPFAIVPHLVGSGLWVGMPLYYIILFLYYTFLYYTLLYYSCTIL